MEQIILGLGDSGEQVLLNAAMANRHGVITGATGTGKTVTLQVLAESFSALGVPVFAADIKGDLSGLAAEGKPHPRIDERVNKIGLAGYRQHPFPLLLWDLLGRQGHPVRTTISEMGPTLLANLLELNETQEGVLHVAFAVADDQGLLLLDLKDLRSMLAWVGENARELRNEYGNVTPQSVASIQRRLLVLDNEGGERFFGEPALRIEHLMQRDFSGNGVISLLDATGLQSSPRIYSTFLLWLLSELMEELPEQGDAPLPRLVFFFDEAHLLFSTAPKPLLEKITQVVRLIRSKGVGVFFITQFPNDIPEAVLGQLGCRIQHALRAYTPRDHKAIRAAAEGFRPRPGLDTAAAITELGVGEALISTLDEKGRPSMVERTLISPPRSRIGPLAESERGDVKGRSPLKGLYDEAVDRESAYEILKKRQLELEEKARRQAESKGVEKPGRTSASGGSRRQSVGEAFFKSIVRTVGSQLGRQIVRGILGSMRGR